MKTAHQNLGVESLSRNGARLLPNMWIKWAVFFFFVAALFGLALRYFFIGHLPEFVDYKNILHAHSHLALLGWGYLLVSCMLLFTFAPQPLRRTSYKIILILNILANLGMMATFPVQGYGPGSIAFSTLHLLVSYVFSFRFLKDIKGLKSTPYLSLIKYGVRWMVLSSVGLWSIAPVGIILGKLHPLYHLSVQWFLHFQLQGWFVYCLLGLLLFFLKKGNNLLSFSKKEELYLHLSLFLTFGGTIFHSYAWMGWYWLNLIGVGLQAYVFFRLLLPLWNCTFHIGPDTKYYTEIIDRSIDSIELDSLKWELNPFLLSLEKSGTKPRNYNPNDSAFQARKSISFEEFKKRVKEIEAEQRTQNK